MGVLISAGRIVLDEQDIFFPSTDVTCVYYILLDLVTYCEFPPPSGEWYYQQLCGSTAFGKWANSGTFWRNASFAAFRCMREPVDGEVEDHFAFQAKKLSAIQVRKLR